MRFILSLIFIFVLFSISYSIFEPVSVGGRYFALGIANISDLKDAYSMIYNPAGLSYVNDLSVSASFSEPFGVPGANIINVNIGGNVFDVLSLGINVVSYGADINSTSGLRSTVLGFGLARLIELSEFIDVIDSISIGLSVKGLGLSVRGYELDNSVNTDHWGFNTDIGTILSFGDEFLNLGIVVYNIVPYKFVLYSNSKGSDVYSAVKFGTSVNLIKPYLKAFGAYALGLNSSSQSSLSVGTEISYLDTIFTRFGVKDGKVSMGIGVRGPNFEVNFGTQSRENLGWYYQIDLVGFVDIF